MAVLVLMKQVLNYWNSQRRGTSASGFKVYAGKWNLYRPESHRISIGTRNCFIPYGIFSLVDSACVMGMRQLVDTNYHQV